MPTNGASFSFSSAARSISSLAIVGDALDRLLACRLRRRVPPVLTLPDVGLRDVALLLQLELDHADAHVGAADVGRQDGVVAGQHPARRELHGADQAGLVGMVGDRAQLDGDAFAGQQHRRRGPSPARRCGWRSGRRRARCARCPSRPSAAGSGAPRWPARRRTPRPRCGPGRPPPDRRSPSSCRASPWRSPPSACRRTDPRHARAACRASPPGWRGRRGGWRDRRRSPPRRAAPRCRCRRSRRAARGRRGSAPTTEEQARCCLELTPLSGMARLPPRAAAWSRRCQRNGAAAVAG